MTDKKNGITIWQLDNKCPKCGGVMWTDGDSVWCSKCKKKVKHEIKN